MTLGLTLLLVVIIFFLFSHKKLCSQASGSGQRQRQLIQLIASFNVVLVLSIFCLALWGVAFMSTNLGSIISYDLISFNAFCYAYFHLFNMSETSRRGKILQEISTGGYQKLSDLEEIYSPRVMLRNRLERLQVLGEIRLSRDGRYQYVGRGLIIFEKIFRNLRKIVLGRSVADTRKDKNM
jgi:hypothetical protein